ncbi:class I SAM-dependent methyltransferase [Xenorhabdus bovienii]|nr:class I SAM-dependent methyltransferase [Xenorhabdus bovienii]MDE1473906.1 class I SAM-dependent methyltransferase [Xenorhabdus bovienii]MDE9430028.1 class I SAM-dependent methyltransferase [Xenorhabdus bovienii]MDE9460982.1 class I SAM-dependent methyltransferase [Xenorhabdus bovienii]MDE9464894.1 class I SAM-dependent methyltransferase [Xenorhabdus bovienii]MDE9468281.1 class I SAM-dependent methyltransferase [Xenorhabdus bovienii]
MKHLTLESIPTIKYFPMIGIVRETNRPPGGMNSIRRIAQNAFLNSKTEVLEVGTATGVTAIELAKLTYCKITAIDIDENNLSVACNRAIKENVSKLISFEKRDATDTKFEDKTFDMVFCGNVTSYFDDKVKAIKEYDRVLKDNGLIAAIPMYYIKKPKDSLVDEVSEAIDVKISPLYKKDWIEFFNLPGYELVSCENFVFDDISNAKVEEYVNIIFKQQHLEELDPEIRTALYKRYSYFMHLFRTNLSHMGFSLMLLRKVTFPTEPELFTASPID